MNNRDGSIYNKDDSRPRWRILEVVVRENAAIEVSILDLQVPRYSFRIGTAIYPKVEGDSIVVTPWLTTFNARDAVDLLAEVEAKYNEIREDKIDELEKRKQRAIRNSAANPPVSVRRNRVE